MIMRLRGRMRLFFCCMVPRLGPSGSFPRMRILIIGTETMINTSLKTLRAGINMAVYAFFEHLLRKKD